MAEPAIKTVPMTFEQAAELDPDLYPGEIADGEWIPVTKSTWRHGEVAMNTGFRLKQYSMQHPGVWSVVCGDPGTRLRRNPDILRGPDVAVTQVERKPTGKGAEGWLEGAPDLVVEVVGDRQTASELARKGLEYLAAGAQIVWVLDPDPETVMVLTPPNHLQILGAGDTLDGGDLLPGFSCPVSELFE
jgi:Uma2 family endonuclease